MGQISIRHGHKLGAGEAAARLKLLAEEFGRSYGLKVEVRGNSATFAGGGVSGRAEVDGESVTVEARLPLLIPAELVEEGVREALRRHFG